MKQHRIWSWNSSVGPASLRRLVAHPPVVPCERVLGALEEVRDPADVALGEREAQVREPVPEVGPEQIAERVDRHHRRQVHRRPAAARRATSTPTSTTSRRGSTATVPSSQHAANSGSHAPEWMLGIPSPAGFSENVIAWQPFAARRRTSARGGVDVEQRHDPARDEPVRVRAAPLVDVPVVVGADHHEVHVAVGARAQHLPREPGPVREVQPGELPAGRHVEHACVDVVATGTHVLVAQRIDVEHLRRLARDRVQPEVPAPELAVVPLQPAVRLLHDARRTVAVPRRARGRRTSRPARRCGRRPTPGRAAPASTAPIVRQRGAGSATDGLASAGAGGPQAAPDGPRTRGRGRGGERRIEGHGPGRRADVRGRGRPGGGARPRPRGPRRDRRRARRGREPGRDRHRRRPHRPRPGRRRVRRDRRPVGRVQRARQRGRTGRGRHPPVRGPRRRRVDGDVRHRDARARRAACGRRCRCCAPPTGHAS